MKQRTVTLFAGILVSILADGMPAHAHTDLFRRTSSDTLVHWEGPSVRMLVDPALEQRFGTGVHAALSEAASAWDLGGQVPHLELVDDLTKSDFERLRTGGLSFIGLADAWTFGDKLAVTVSTFDSDTGAMVAAQIWINPDRAFELGAAGPAPGDQTYDLQAVLTHELGHVLGLGEAEHAPDATMFPTFSRGESHQRTLSQTDEEAVDELYALTCSPQPMTQCSSAQPGVDRGHSWGLLMLVCALFIRRSPTVLCP